MKTSKLSASVYALISELEVLAQICCQVGNTEGVHFLVSEQNRLMQLERSLRAHGFMLEGDK